MNGDEDYTEEELAGLNTWNQLTHELLPEWPFKFYFAKLKSNSPELDALIKDPKAVLQGGHESLAALSAQNELAADLSTVTTTIFRHDRTLNARLVYMLVAVDAQDSSASMSSHKASDRQDS